MEKSFTPEYKEYMASEEWKMFRKSILEQRGEVCEVCSKFGNHVHHKTYKNFKREKVFDVLVLCEVCHGIVHEIKDAKKSGFEIYGLRTSKSVMSSQRIESVLLSKIKEKENSIKVLEYVLASH